MSARERVEARRGETVVLLDKKSGFNFSRVALYELSIDCEELRREIFNYCSPKENESGCTEKSCSTFSFHIGEKNVSVTPLNASDGCYCAKIFANDVVEKTLIIGANIGMLLFCLNYSWKVLSCMSRLNSATYSFVRVARFLQQTSPSATQN